MVLIAEPDEPLWDPSLPTGTKESYPVLNGHGTFRPCWECNPKGYERWERGAYQRGGLSKPPTREPPPDYQEQIF